MLRQRKRKQECVSETPAVQVEEPKSERPHRQILIYLCLVCALEGADAMLLPACFHALELDLGLTPVSLSYMSMAQALTQATAAPLWGILADKGHLKRSSILAVGCCGWGVVTILLGMACSLHAMVVLRAVNGCLLACLTPVSQGIVADVTTENQRGTVIGFLQFSINVGNMASSLIATPLASQILFGVRGWRVTFGTIGVLSLLMSLAVAFRMEEPPRELSHGRTKGRGGGVNGVSAELARLWEYLKTPTFDVVVLQGVFGSVPWNALGFATMYFQLAGLTDPQASSLSALLFSACAVGSLLGGVVGDALARISPNHGRAFTAQLSVLGGMPLVLLIFWGVPPKPQSYPVYLALVASLGLISSWCGTGVKRPILSEIVDADGRSVIIAWDTALEGSSAALFGAPAVAFLAEKCFGYNVHSGTSLDSPTSALLIDAQAQNRRALGLALVTSTLGPWLLCFFFFSLLHWSYPRDRAQAVARRSASQSPAADGVPVEQYAALAQVGA